MDYKLIATMFGRGIFLYHSQNMSIKSLMNLGATYDAIEGHFRKIKRLAASLPDEHCDSTSPPSTPSTTVRAQRKAKAANTAFEDIAPRQKTLAGRITKSKTKNSLGRVRKGTVLAVAGADREGEIDLDEEVQQSSSAPLAVQGVVVENSFEALMGGWHLGLNGGAGDIFMGLPGEVGSDMGVDRPGG